MSTELSGHEAATDATNEVLSVSGLGVRLGGRDVLRGVTFSIGAGEFTGLIGPNGAGKTTLLKAILGLAPLSAGTIHVGRRQQATRTGPGIPRRLGRRALIGYVPQQYALDPDAPVRARDLVGLGLDGHRLGIGFPSRERRQRVDRMLAAVDALQFADARVGELSGGQQQRVLIAHALIAGPPLLLLDEPLANLDLRSANEIVELLARIAADQQLAVLISAHEINPLLRVMDRIVYVAGGRAASGKASDVIRGDVLSHLYGYHVDVLRVHGRIIVVSGAAAGEGRDDGGERGVEVVA